MAKQVAEPCRNCGADLAPGSSFCTLCGTAVLNRAAVSVPAAAEGSIPGIVPVGVGNVGPLVAPVQVGGNAQFAAAAALSPGGAGRRLAAKVIDGVVPAAVVGIATFLAIILMSVAASGDPAQADLTGVMLIVAAGSLMSLAYVVWLWIWEARAGKTPGNLMLGLRTTNMAGGPAGILAIFLRGLIVGVASIVPAIGPLLVIISNAWDPHGKRQGWHDKVANTLVFNIKTGRNPMETGGVEGRADFTPAPVPTLTPVASPMPAPAVGGQGIGGQAPYGQGTDGQAPGGLASTQGRPMQSNGPITSVPGFANPNAEAPNQSAPAGALGSFGAFAPADGNSPRQAPAPYSEPSSFAPPPAAAAAQFAQPTGTDTTDPLPGLQKTAPLDPGSDVNSGAADDEAGETRLRPSSAPAPLHLNFDDGATKSVDTVALIGRNPAGYDGEMISSLISVRDTSMTVSKTHLHVRASNEGLWVIDRNSTNGSAITRADGVRTALVANTPALAEPGARVHFGDRSFIVGRA